MDKTVYHKRIMRWNTIRNSFACVSSWPGFASEFRVSDLHLYFESYFGVFVYACSRIYSQRELLFLFCQSNRRLINLNKNEYRIHMFSVFLFSFFITECIYESACAFVMIVPIGYCISLVLWFWKRNGEFLIYTLIL